MWKIFQLLVVFAVVGSNIEWQWTDNPLAATVVGIGVAFVLTEFLTWLLDLGRRSRAASRRLVGGKQLKDNPRPAIAPRSQLLNARNTLIAAKKKAR